MKISAEFIVDCFYQQLRLYAVYGKVGSVDLHSEPDHSNSSISHPAKGGSLKIVVGLNLLLVVVLAFSGYRYHSLVLYSAAVHQFVDSAGVGITLSALILSLRPASSRHSYGLARLEILAALFNGVILLATTAWIVVEAVHRIELPTRTSGGAVAELGIVGGVISLVSFLLLHEKSPTSLAMRINALHFAADSFAWVVTIGSGLLIIATGAKLIDPISSILVSSFVLFATWKLVAQTVDVLLEATPRDVVPSEIVTEILRQPDITDVHHLHIWSLGSETPALSAHIVFTESIDLHVAQVRADAIKEILAERFHIDHATLEIECHPCEAPTH